MILGYLSFSNRNRVREFIPIAKPISNQLRPIPADKLVINSKNA